MVFQVRTKLLTLAVIAGFLIAAVPALAQDDTSSYTSTTPTVTTPTTPTTDTSAVAPESDSGTAGTGSSGGQLAHTGSDTWLLLGIGGALALGSALLLARERRPRRNR
jgi:LPXTG-motif cell wall-anchored protein